MATPRYITSADLLSIWPAYLKIDLLDDDHDDAEDAGLADQLIEDAADEVDSILSFRYSVPFDTSNPPKLVKYATKWITWYNAHIRRSKVKEFITERYNKVLETLYAAADPKARDIISGMGEDPSPDEHSDMVGSVAVGSSTRVMTRETLAASTTGY